MNLTINNSDNTSSSVTACDEFTWDGQTYTESGEYTNTYTNTNGCDSTHTLNLTINNEVVFFEDVSACGSYEWNGETYTESGTYEYSVLESNNNYSMSFDGINNKVTIPDHPNQVGMSELSIMFWAKFDSYPDWQNSNGGHMLFEKFEHVSANADLSYGVYTEYDYDALRFDIKLNNGNMINLRMEPFSSYLSLNTWHHIAAVYDGQFSHIYFDGILISIFSEQYCREY